MRVFSFVRVVAVLAVAALLAAVAAPDIAAALAAVPDVVTGTAGAGVVLASMLALPSPLDLQSLTRLRTAPPGGFEAVEDVLFDTMTYPAAGLGAGGRLAFFQTAANTADKSLTNFDIPGQLPAPQWFHAKRIFVDFLAEPSITAAATAAGRMADIEKILNTARTRLELYNSATGRVRSGIPLRMIGGSGGGVVGNLATTQTAPGTIQQARTAGQGGFPVDIIIAHGETISASLIAGAAAAISADLPIVVTFYGWRYVKAG